MRSAAYDLVLLDRDGVINEDLPTSVRSWSDFQFIPSSLEALTHLSQQKLKIALVTNQAIVGRGDLSLKTLQDIHKKMVKVVEGKKGHIDRLYHCTDTTIEPNYRRKPAPGMLLEACHDFQILPKRTLMIGDALRDFQAAQRAECDFVLVRTGKGVKTERKLPDTPKPQGIYDDLHAAVLNIFP